MSEEKQNSELQENESNESIDLSIDLNPEMYLNSEHNPQKSRLDSLYVAAEEKTYKAEEPVMGEEPNGKRRFAVAKQNGGMASLFDWVRCIAFAIAIVVICLTFVFRLVDVDGPSMEDTLQSHDKVIITDMFYTPHNNDIIVISHAANHEEPIIKRVIATEGQTLQLDYDNDRIIVDGIEIEESYIKGTTFSENYGNYQIPEVIPKGKIFVMGDNRHVSLDSRSSDIGLIDVSSVIGKAQLVAWPPADFGYLY